jgi:hypothetical protein
MASTLFRLISPECAGSAAANTQRCPLRSEQQSQEDK